MARTNIFYYLIYLMLRGIIVNEKNDRCQAMAEQ